LCHCLSGYIYLFLGGSVSSFDPSWDTNQNSGSDARLMSQEGVFQLTKDLRKFSEALTALKAVFLDERGVVPLVLLCVILKFFL